MTNAEDNEPVPDVIVSIHDGLDGTELEVVETDKNGTASYEGAEPGDVLKIATEKEGYIKTEDRYTVPKAEDLTYIVTITKELAVSTDSL